MRDKLHQPYREGLIPGLTKVIHSISPKTHPGLLGICLSGAGPTILALAMSNFDQIADSIMKVLSNETIDGRRVTCEWLLLQPANDGATVVEVLES